jgi:pimeloyl-ACP methyl ester carboxylesterase
VLRRLTAPDGVELACEVAGHGPPLVMVHGAGSARWGFDLVRRPLERRFTIWALDRRGRGDSADGDGYALDRWQSEFLGGRSGTIWGGTAQVQRNIVGERVLGLPKEPGHEGSSNGKDRA